MSKGAESDEGKRTRTQRNFPVVEASEKDGAGDNGGKLRNVSGPRIKLRRLQKKWTQQRLADEIAEFSGDDWNPTQPDVRRIEAQRRIVSDRDLLYIASALRCTAAWLLGEEEALEPDAPPPEPQAAEL